MTTEDLTRHTVHEREGILLRADGGTERFDASAMPAVGFTIRLGETLSMHLLNGPSHEVNVIATIVAVTNTGGEADDEITGDVIFLGPWSDDEDDFLGLNDASRPLAFAVINAARGAVPAAYTSEPTDPPVTEFTVEAAYAEDAQRTADAERTLNQLASDEAEAAAEAGQQ